MGPHCGAHTFPYIEVKNPTAVVEHEATTSKISEDQLFYCLQRGISAEDAVNMIVNGFCRAGVPRVADGIRGGSAEPAGGEPRRSGGMSDDGQLILEVRDLRVRAGERLILDGLSLAVRAGEVHAIMGPNGSGKSTLTGVLAGRPGYEVVSGQRHLPRARPACDGTRAAGARGPVPRVPVPGRDSGRQQRVPAEGRAECAAQASRTARARRLRVPEPGAREARLHAHGRDAPEPGRQRGLLGRREEAQRDHADEPARADARAPRRDGFGPRHRCPQGRRGRRQCDARDPGAPSCS